MLYAKHSVSALNSQNFHHLVYSDWGNEDGQAIICVHGLTGNGHDFDFIAPKLVEDGYRVIAVDLPGRGRSDFLNNPLDYNYNQYYQDLTTLLAHLNLTEPGSVDWLGISLGGLLGIYLASLEGSPIRRLILNDVGPVVPKEALDFIYHVIAQDYRFDTVQDLEKRMRETRGLSWGPVTDEQWHHMAEHNARALDDGSVTYAYDPKIAEIFKTAPIGDDDLWQSWEALTCPVLELHGAQSLVLTDDITKEMEKRYQGPSFEIVKFDDCGHVPSLMAPYQIEVVQKWLNSKPT